MMVRIGLGTINLGEWGSGAGAEAMCSRIKDFPLMDSVIIELDHSVCSRVLYGQALL